VPVIILTAPGTISTAVEAMKLGAFDFLQKPIDNEVLEIVIRKALDFSLHTVEGHAYLAGDRV
jgi:FixJ family two-component response regulator